MTPANPNNIIGKLPHGTPIKDGFLLNSNGRPLEANKQQLPYYGTDNRPYLGIQFQGQIGAINADHLSKFSLSAPTAHSGGPLTLDNDQIEINADNSNTQSILTAQKLVTEFHNSICGNLQNTAPSNMAAQIKALNDEWAVFIKQKLADAKSKAVRPDLATQLKIARNLDLVARTILYEADIMGLREGFVKSRSTNDNQIAYETCISDETCPLSACERDIMTLTIRNRGLARRECGSKESRRKLEEKNPNACKYYGDFAYRATNPVQYNIWDPRWTSKYITACFLKNDLEKTDSSKNSVETDWTLKRSIGQFKLTLNTAMRVLYGAEEKLHGYFKYDSDMHPPDSTLINNMKHYVHPLAMPLCKFGSFDTRISVLAAYAEKISENTKDSAKNSNQSYTLLIDEVLIAESTLLNHPTREHDTNKFRQVYLNDDDLHKETGWFVDASEIKDLPSGNSTNICAPMGLTYLKDKDISACSVNKMADIPNYQDSWREQSRFVPKWATTAHVRQPILGCNIVVPQAVEIGHKCDPRFQHYASVDPKPSLAPFHLIGQSPQYFQAAKPPSASIAGHTVNVVNNPDDELELVSKKNNHIASTLVLTQSSSFNQIISLKKVSLANDWLALDYKSTFIGSFEQKTCAYIALVSVSAEGKLNLVDKKKYSCEIISESAKQTAKSFDYKYEINIKKSRIEIL